ncbi:MAG: hypothetical protein M5U26_01360 [Planctomycetota bacterium]|nr:hypothetical protein [Planctomycetota bacterium]
MTEHSPAGALGETPEPNRDRFERTVRWLGGEMSPAYRARWPRAARLLNRAYVGTHLYCAAAALLVPAYLLLLCFGQERSGLAALVGLLAALALLTLVGYALLWLLVIICTGFKFTLQELLAGMLWSGGCVALLVGFSHPVTTFVASGGLVAFVALVLARIFEFDGRDKAP